MRERRLWMVKTDIEFATLYAALLLRLRNPREADFLLSWRLQEGDCAALHAPLTARALNGAAAGPSLLGASPCRCVKCRVASPIPGAVGG